MNEYSDFSDSNLLHLNDYEEIIGRVEQIERNEGYVYVHLSTGSLIFEQGTPQAVICAQTLAGKEGRLVGIIRIPNQEPVIRIQFISED